MFLHLKINDINLEFELNTVRRRTTEHHCIINNQIITFIARYDLIKTILNFSLKRLFIETSHENREMILHTWKRNVNVFTRRREYNKNVSSSHNIVHKIFRNCLL